MSDISIIVRGMRTNLERNCAEHGLGFPEQITLMYLRANGTKTQNAIAGSLSIDKGAIAKTVAKLVDKGLVEREVNPDSKREKLVTLTKEGERLMDELTNAYAQLESQMFFGLSEEQKAMTLEALEVIADNLSDDKGAR